MKTGNSDHQQIFSSLFSDSGLFNFVADPTIKVGTVYFVPPVTRTLVHFEQTGETKEIWEWNPKAGAVMYNVGNPESGQKQ